MTISAHIIDKQKIKQIDDFLSVVASLKKDGRASSFIMGPYWWLGRRLSNARYFWFAPISYWCSNSSEPSSKVEEYDTYLFTIIDGVRIEEKGEFTEDDL